MRRVPRPRRYVPRLVSHADLWALAANIAIKAQQKCRFLARVLQSQSLLGWVGASATAFVQHCQFQCLSTHFLVWGVKQTVHSSEPQHSHRILTLDIPSLPKLLIGQSLCHSLVIFPRADLSRTLRPAPRAPVGFLAAPATHGVCLFQDLDP